MATPDQDDLGGMTLPTSPRQNAPAPPPTFPTLHVSQEPFNFVKNYIPTESPPKPMVHAGNKHKLSTGNLLSGLGNSAGNLFGLGNSAGNLFEAIGFGVSSSGSSSMPTVAVQPGGQRAAALSPIDHEVHHDKRQRRVPWTNTEDVTILALHRRLGTQWDKIAAQLPGRTADAVRNRCFRLQKQHPMATAPDALDGLLMATHGIEPPTDDAEAAHAKGRGVSTEHGRHAWSPDEDKIIVEGVNKLGCKWREIAKFLPGRTDSMCRNRWMRLQKERYDERTDSGRAASPPRRTKTAAVTARTRV